MRWYYANDNHRQGPVSDSELARLAREGVIRDDTLVWRQGLKDWQRYAEVAPPPTPPDLPPPLGTADIEPSLPGAAEVLAALPPALNYAGFWLRAAAKIIDLIILNVLVMGVVLALGLMPPLGDAGNPDELARFMEEMRSLSRVVLCVSLAYSWFFTWRFAGTPGKLLLGLKIVRRDGSRLSQLQIVGRFFGEILNQILFGVGYLVAAVDEEKRTLHDYMCDSRVVSKRR